MQNRRHSLSIGRLAALALVSAGLGACSNVNLDYDASKAHHRPSGFQNNDIEFEPLGVAELLCWRWRAASEGLPPPPHAPIPRVAADIAFLRANAGAAAEPAVTWIGHSTVLAQVGGLNLLTDPVFSARASPLAFVGPKRQQPPAVALAELPHIELVLVSHNHYDHLDAGSVDALNAQAGGPPLFIVPLGIGPWLAGRGIVNVAELDWWQSRTLRGPQGEVEVMLVPAQHWSGRGLTDRMHTLWGSFAVFAPDAHLFFAGDTGYSRDFANAGRRFAERQQPSSGGGFDLALLPIGAYEPRSLMARQHVNVDEAVMIHLDLGAKRSLGVHWGTFELTDEALDAAPLALPAARSAHGVSDGAFLTIAIGETLRLKPR